MFIKFFKSGFPIQYITAASIGLLLWIRAFIYPLPMPAPQGPAPLYTLLYELLSGYPHIASVLGFLLVLIESIWLTSIFNQHHLVVKNSSLSALVFLVLISFSPGLLTLTPVNIALFFLIVIMGNLLRSYNKPEHLDLVFGAGFFTTIASFFYPAFLIWFVFVPISFVIFRSGYWREWIVSLIGLTTPFIFLSVYYFWQDELIMRTNSYVEYFSSLHFQTTPPGNNMLIIFVLTLLIALWGIYSFWSGPLEKTVEIRAKTNLFSWVVIFTGISFIFAHAMALFHPALAFPAIALAITGTLNNLKKTWIAEWICFIYFIVILLNNTFCHQLADLL